MPCRARVSSELVYACACLVWFDLVSRNASVVGCKGRESNGGGCVTSAADLARYLAMIFLSAAKARERRLSSGPWWPRRRAVAKKKKESIGCTDWADGALWSRLKELEMRLPESRGQLRRDRLVQLGGQLQYCSAHRDVGLSQSTLICMRPRRVTMSKRIGCTSDHPADVSEQS